MKREIQESITFLMSEFKRLKKKQEIEELTEEEKDSFIGSKADLNTHFNSLSNGNERKEEINENKKNRDFLNT